MLTAIHSEVALQPEIVTYALVEIQTDVPRLAATDILWTADIDTRRWVVALCRSSFLVVVIVADCSTERGLATGKYHVVGKSYVMSMGIQQVRIALCDVKRIGEVAVANSLDDFWLSGSEAVLQ